MYRIPYNLIVTFTVLKCVHQIIGGGGLNSIVIVVILTYILVDILCYFIENSIYNFFKIIFSLNISLFRKYNILV